MWQRRGAVRQLTPQIGAATLVEYLNLFMCFRQINLRMQLLPGLSTYVEQKNVGYQIADSDEVAATSPESSF